MRARKRLRRLRGPGGPPWADALPVVWRRMEAAVDAANPRVIVGAAAAAAALGLFLGGPVAAAVGGCYAAAAIVLWRRNRASRALRRTRHRVRGDVAMLAAELRAGAAPGELLDAAQRRLSTPDDPLCRTLGARVAALRAISERTGAPAAELLDRLAADLRARAGAEATLDGQIAGTRASVALLAALPVLGLLLGQAIGTDPVTFLLGTPAGAACAAAAVTLQALGLTWSRRIIAAVTP